MTFQNQKIWAYANSIFFRLFFFINSICLLCNTILFFSLKDFKKSFIISLTTFGLATIITVLGLEFFLVYKYYIKKELR